MEELKKSLPPEKWYMLLDALNGLSYIEYDLLRSMIKERQKDMTSIQNKYFRNEEKSYEVRKDEDGSLDGIVAREAFIHMEKMDDKVWSILVITKDADLYISGQDIT